MRFLVGVVNKHGIKTGTIDFKRELWEMCALFQINVAHPQEHLFGLGWLYLQGACHCAGWSKCVSDVGQLVEMR